MIPGYTFVQFIERGGMGAVYKAVQKSLNRTVAVKLLPQVHRNKESFAERFKREAHALALLNHPHIIAVHDFGETPDGQMYYEMCIRDRPVKRFEGLVDSVRWGVVASEGDTICLLYTSRCV